MNSTKERIPQGIGLGEAMKQLDSHVSRRHGRHRRRKQRASPTTKPETEVKEVQAETKEEPQTTITTFHFPFQTKRF